MRIYSINQAKVLFAPVTLHHYLGLPNDVEITGFYTEADPPVLFVTVASPRLPHNRSCFPLPVLEMADLLALPDEVPEGPVTTSA